MWPHVTLYVGVGDSNSDPAHSVISPVLIFQNILFQYFCARFTLQIWLKEYTNNQTITLMLFYVENSTKESSFFFFFLLILLRIYYNFLSHIHSLLLLPPDPMPFPTYSTLCLIFKNSAKFSLRYLYTLECGQLIRGHRLKEILCLHSPWLLLTNNLSARMGVHAHLPSSCWDFVWLELAQVSCMLSYLF